MGAVYEGGWKYDMQHGYGVEKWLSTGSIFQGQFVDGLRNGHGVWINNNKRYEGQWKNNMMDGEGTMDWGVQMLAGAIKKTNTGTTGGTDALKK